jgi:DNA-binding NarL/FixJ family response regulator
MLDETVHQIQATAPRNFYGPLSGLVAMIGRRDFEMTLMHQLSILAEADHVTIFRTVDGQPQHLAALSADDSLVADHQSKLYVEREVWRRDPGVSEVEQCGSESNPILFRLNVASMPAGEMRDLIYGPLKTSERVMICGNGSDGAISISLMRSKARNGAGESGVLLDVAASFFQMLIKHREMQQQSRRLATSLNSLAEIEFHCRHAPDQLPRREVEVCARVLYGLSTLGISLDLGIGQETVMTYRKRAYGRLMISSHRELIAWYLRLWNDHDFLTDERGDQSFCHQAACGPRLAPPGRAPVGRPSRKVVRPDLIVAT